MKLLEQIDLPSLSLLETSFLQFNICYADGGDLSRMGCAGLAGGADGIGSLGTEQINSSETHGLTVIAFGALSLSNVSQLSEGTDSDA
jgi:hypothetical protein